MFERLKKAVENHYTNEAKSVALFVKRGYYPDWAEEHRNDRDRGIKQHATAATLKAYQLGKITRAQAVEKATKRAMQEVEKRYARDLQKIASAENAPDVVQIDLHVEWKKSKTWGYNPHCDCWAGGMRTTGRASGCGYDKRSAATAEAFNENPSIIKLLYMAEEKRLAKRQKPSRRDSIGYGSGVCVLPSFEGGVGIESIKNIFGNMGFTFRTVADTSVVDAYTIEKKQTRSKSAK